MKSIGIIALVFAALLLAIGAPIVIADNEASFITANPHVDGAESLECANSSNNCNGFSAKEFVWLNGASIGHGIGENGTFFFAVLDPGGQSDPNDGSDKNLSNDYDDYTNRSFEISEGVLTKYSGTHWLDSGKNESLDGETVPNGLPPYLNLFPYADTLNPGGVYLLAVCSLDHGYPVDPSDCKFESFKVNETTSHNSFFLSGTVFEDMYADGVRNGIDVGIKNQRITLSGVGSDGKTIEAKATSDADGNWQFRPRDFSFVEGLAFSPTDLKLCAELEPGWSQSYPVGDDCHHLSFPSLSLGAPNDLSFGSWRSVEVTACKARRNKGEKEPQAGWSVSLISNGEAIDSQVTDFKGCYTWTGLTPGTTYGVSLDAGPEGQPIESMEFEFTRAKSGDQLLHTFSTAPEGCTPGFWQGGNAGGSTGGKWLWDAQQDLDWILSGGQDWNPFTWTTVFNDYFTPVTLLDGTDMMTLVNMGGAMTDYQLAARDLVAAYLNASWGMNYPYDTAALAQMWSDTVETEQFEALHVTLDAANNAHQVGGSCPIDAKNEGFGYFTFLPVIFR